MPLLNTHAVSLPSGIGLQKALRRDPVCAESQASEHVATQHDDFCKLCRREGDLLCCNGCSAAFHLSCLAMQRAPVGRWYCAVCRDA